MKAVADFILAVADLIQAEARAARKAVYRLAWSVILISCACLLVLAGAGMLGLALYQSLLPWWGPAGSSVGTGAALLAAGAVVAGVAKWLAK